MAEKRQLFKAVGLMGSIALVLVIAMISLFFHASAAECSQHLKKLSTILTVCRCSIYAVIFFLWPIFMRYLSKHYCWSTEHLTYAINQRYFLLGGLILLELLLAQNIIGVVGNFII